MDQSRSLLALTAAIAADNGDGVARVLRTQLIETTRFDRGEIAVARPLGCERWTLTAEATPLAAEDLVMRVAASREVVSLEDVSQTDAYPRTRRLLERAGQRALLALPLNTAGGLDGAVLLAQRHAWAFAGVSLNRLGALVGMAGLALERSIALTALERELARAREASVAAGRAEAAEPLIELAVERDTLAEQLTRASSELAALQDQQRQSLERVQALEAEIERLRREQAATRRQRRRQALLPEASAPREPSDT